ncbi:hypothetical protein HYT24_01600, partial [Candidatus Pacearchaeota archaeon]|nr:hypothetical protein [Candidatus Pacearchaeota archaeon]
VLPFAILLVGIFLWVKYGFRKGIGGILIGLGILLVIGGMTIAYDKASTIIMGGLSFIVGLVVWGK